MRRVYLLVAVLGVLVLASVTGATAQDSRLSAAVQFAAGTYGVPADSLEVVYETSYEVAAVGEVSVFKMAVGDGDAIYGAVVDQSGQAYTPEEFRARADAAYREQYGKMEIGLYQRFEQSPEAVIPVAIWLAVDDSLYAGLRGSDHVGSGVGVDGAEPPEIDALEADRNAPGSAANQPAEPEPSVIAAQQAVDAAVVAVQDAVAARLADKGIAVEAVERTPLLTATLGRAQVEELAQDPDVSWIYADDVENVDMNDSATNTQRGFGPMSRGYVGAGSKVAILEDSRAYQNFWLYNFIATRVPSDPNMDNHATQTMGNVGSSHGRRLGMARDASTYSANATTYSNANLQAAANWAVAQGVHVINNSWGPSSPTGCVDTMGIFFDYRTVADAVLVTHAAGNSGNLMGDQAMAFNILAVGAIDDRNNAGWNDDTMASYSGFQEGSSCSPSNSDRNEPDVVAVGSRIKSTRIHPPSIDPTQVQGTSYAAPMVAGMAALMIDVDGNLAWKPEALRALTMASAYHNIEGSARLSEYDGAGGIDAYSGYLDALNNRWSQVTINPNTWTQTDYSFTAGVGDIASCVVAWTSHPNGSYTSDPLETDIDLALINPNGNAVQYSTSVRNNYEIVRANVSQGGTWKCRVYKFSTSGNTTWEFLGVSTSVAFQYPYDYPEW